MDFAKTVDDAYAYAYVSRVEIFGNRFHDWLEFRAGVKKKRSRYTDIFIRSSRGKKRNFERVRTK